MNFVFLLSISLTTLFGNQTAHDLPDGVVKVATQVIVQPDHTMIRYDVGFNPQTLDQLMKVYSPDTSADASVADKMEAFKKAFKEKIEETIMVKVDDKTIAASDISFEATEIAKHVQARFQLDYDVVIAKESKMQILDTCFQEMGRIWNAGLKANLPVAVKECSTKAIPLRSKPQEKEAGEAEPFEIEATVARLSINVDSDEATTSMGPLFVLLFALGGAGVAGLLLVPNEDSGDDHHDHH